MPRPPEFSSLIISVPGPRGRLYARIRSLAWAAALYGAALLALGLFPFLLTETMRPSRAGVDINEPPIRVDFHQPRGRGRSGRAGDIRHGSRDGRKGGGRTTPPPPRATLSPRPAARPVPPPEAETQAASGPMNGVGPSDQPYGDLLGTGTRDRGVVDSDCPECTGSGGGDESDGPLDPGTPGLMPPILVPGTRALPKYPDLARRAGLMGTVILLVVVEKDGSVGEIEVVKSPDQRWGFDLSAIDAVKMWRYQPALMNGSPVAAYIQVMVEFTLAR
jgi:TonB family protein